MTFSVPHTGCQLRAVSEQVELRPVRCFIAEFLSFLRNECGNVYSCQCKFCFKTCPALNETDLKKNYEPFCLCTEGRKHVSHVILWRLSVLLSSKLYW